MFIEWIHELLNKDSTKYFTAIPSRALLYLCLSWQREVCALEILWGPQSTFTSDSDSQIVITAATLLLFLHLTDSKGTPTDFPTEQGSWFLLCAMIGHGPPEPRPTAQTCPPTPRVVPNGLSFPAGNQSGVIPANSPSLGSGSPLGGWQLLSLLWFHFH